MALWLVKKSEGPKFQAWTEDVKATKSLEKNEKWKSEKQMLEEHSWSRPTSNQGELGGERVPGLMQGPAVQHLPALGAGHDNG